MSMEPTSDAGQGAALSEQQLRMYRGSFWLFILAETMVFVTLFAVRFVFVYGPPPAELNTTLAGVLTAVMVVSAAPAWLARRAIAAGDPGAMVRHAGIAFVLGSMVLAGIVYDWVTAGLPAASRFGENYYLTTAFHALHIAIGLLTLAAVVSAGRRARYSAADHWWVDNAVVFWEFVVVAWIGVYVVFFWL